MQIFEHELSVEEKDPCVHAAKMLIIKAKVIAFSPSKTIETAAILQGYGQLASTS